MKNNLNKISDKDKVIQILSREKDQLETFVLLIKEANKGNVIADFVAKYYLEKAENTYEMLKSDLGMIRAKISSGKNVDSLIKQIQKYTDFSKYEIMEMV